jgi:hypothetical protein
LKVKIKLPKKFRSVAKLVDKKLDIKVVTLRVNSKLNAAMSARKLTEPTAANTHICLVTNA